MKVHEPFHFWVYSNIRKIWWRKEIVPDFVEIYKYTTNMNKINRIWNWKQTVFTNHINFGWSNQINTFEVYKKENAGICFSRLLLSGRRYWVSIPGGIKLGFQRQRWCRRITHVSIAKWLVKLIKFPWPNKPEKRT